ncbi:hypothetical protein CDAR_22251 [Caerostris darwini]|uniref:BRCT domain-containing protein n=1 Tax=Caerostris darwini TaxID=1538125 RepID=A0AAV4URZ8_9ARAC|nr:hypothetical protein CDAR_22251 [Caerostris darwini]
MFFADKKNLNDPFNWLVLFSALRNSFLQQTHQTTKNVRHPEDRGWGTRVVSREWLVKCTVSSERKEIPIALPGKDRPAPQSGCLTPSFLGGS